MKNKIALLLTLSLLVMSLIPLGAALLFVNEAFISQESVYKSRDLNDVFDTTQKHLRSFSKLEPEKEAELKTLFAKIQDLKLIYGEDSFFSDRLKSSLIKYFIFGFGAVLIFSLLLSLILSKKINIIYKKSFDELQEQKERAQYLEEIARWQEVAQHMAHEIRRPLQPIMTWVSNLKASYSYHTEAKYELLLNEATMAIEEEVHYLNKMVTEFSHFAELPKPNLTTINLATFFENFIEQYSKVWNQIHFSLTVESREIQCRVDVGLLKQVLTNLSVNAIEANPETKIEMKFELKVQDDQVTFEIFNSGVSLSPEQRCKIFDPYYSTKKNTHNKGLGLSIVKLAILEQGGEIHCVPDSFGVRFKIKMPRWVGGENVL